MGSKVRTNFLLPNYLESNWYSINVLSRLWFFDGSKNGGWFAPRTKKLNSFLLGKVPPVIQTNSRPEGLSDFIPSMLFGGCACYCCPPQGVKSNDLINGASSCILTACSRQNRLGIFMLLTTTFFYADRVIDQLCPHRAHFCAMQKDGYDKIFIEHNFSSPKKSTKTKRTPGP